jgi:hypothetical protein
MMFHAMGGGDGHGHDEGGWRYEQVCSSQLAEDMMCDPIPYPDYAGGCGPLSGSPFGFGGRRKEGGQQKSLFLLACSCSQSQQTPKQNTQSARVGFSVMDPRDDAPKKGHHASKVGRKAEKKDKQQRKRRGQEEDDSNLRGRNPKVRSSTVVHSKGIL